MNHETKQLFFDIEVDDSGADSQSVIQFPVISDRTDRANQTDLNYDDLPREPIGKTVCSSIALQRINKRLGEYSIYQLYRAIKSGRIKAFKPNGGRMRSDGKRSNAARLICEESLDRFIARKEIEMQYGG